MPTAARKVRRTTRCRRPRRHRIARTPGWHTATSARPAHSGRPGSRRGSARLWNAAGRRVRTSRSMSIMRPVPGRTRAVMRDGRPNAWPAERQHAEPVDLADTAARRGDQRDVAQDHLPAALFHARGTVALLRDRLVHIPLRHRFARGLLRAVRRFRHDRSRMLSTSSVKLVGIVRQPRGMLDHPRNAAAVQRLRSALRRNRADQPGHHRLRSPATDRHRRRSRRAP